jgi:hypothetical protein
MLERMLILLLNSIVECSSVAIVVGENVRNAIVVEC